MHGQPHIRHQLGLLSFNSLHSPNPNFSKLIQIASNRNPSCFWRHFRHSFACGSKAERTKRVSKLCRLINRENVSSKEPTAVRSLVKISVSYHHPRLGGLPEESRCSQVSSVCVCFTSWYRPFSVWSSGGKPRYVRHMWMCCVPWCGLQNIFKITVL